MRRLPPILLLAVSLAVAGCSSGSPAATAGGASPTEAAAATESPAATPATAQSSAPAATAQPSADMSLFGSQYAKIQSDLADEMAKITASMGTATTLEQLAAIYKQYAEVMRKSIAASRAVSWPAAISSDMNQLLADEEELVGLWETMMSDPTATVDQARMAALQAEMPAIVQRIAAYFGAPTTP